MTSASVRALFLAVCSFAASFFITPAAAASAAAEQPRGVRVIVLDAGHGGKDPGACYRSARESDITLAVVLKLGAMIQRSLPGIRVVYTRTTDRDFFPNNKSQDLQARADIANRASGDLFVSVHVNAAPTTQASGVETLVMGETPLEQNANERALYANNRDELIDMSNERTAAIVRAYIQNLQFTYGEYSEAMARLVQKHHVVDGRRNRGVKRQPLKVLYATDMPGILTEIGFLSNASDYAVLTSDAGQTAIAATLLDAVKDYVAYVRGGLAVEGDARYEKGDDDSVSAPSADDRPTAEQETVREQDAPTPPTPVRQPSVEQGAETYYTIQVLASTRALNTSDGQFKSQRGKVRQMQSSGGVYRYKYCVGRYASAAQARAALAEVRREFSGAFVVRAAGDKIL